MKKDPIQLLSEYIDSGVLTEDDVSFIMAYIVSIENSLIAIEKKIAYLLEERTRIYDVLSDLKTRDTRVKDILEEIRNDTN